MHGKVTKKLFEDHETRITEVTDGGHSSQFRTCIFHMSEADQDSCKYDSVIHQTSFTSNNK